MLLQQRDYQIALLVSFVLHGLGVGGLIYLGTLVSSPRVEYISLIPLEQIRRTARSTPATVKPPATPVSPVQAPAQPRPATPPSPAPQPPTTPPQPAKPVPSATIESVLPPVVLAKPVSPPPPPSPPATPSLKDVLGSIAALPPAPQAEPVPVPAALSAELKQVLSHLEILLPEDSQADTHDPALRHLSAEEATRFGQQLDTLIVNQWALPPQLTETGLVVVVRFRIEKSGKIVSYQIEQLSGNALLDQAVQKLLQDLQFLPPLPDSYTAQYFEFGIRFNPQKFQF